LVTAPVQKTHQKKQVKVGQILAELAGRMQSVTQKKVLIILEPFRNHPMVTTAFGWLGLTPIAST